VEVDVQKALKEMNHGINLSFKIHIELIRVNEAIRSTSVEWISRELRAYMSAMKPIY
jgi:hypothetical protein